jgi:hypothetical protein
MREWICRSVSLTSALVGGEWPTSRSGHLTPGKERSVPIGKKAGWAPELFRATGSPLPGLEFRPLGRPDRSQSLYRLRYPGSRL